MKKNLLWIFVGALIVIMSIFFNYNFKSVGYTWKTYNDSKLDFAFDYPSAYSVRLVNDEESIGDISVEVFDPKTNNVIWIALAVQNPYIAHGLGNYCNVAGLTGNLASKELSFADSFYKITDHIGIKWRIDRRLGEPVYQAYSYAVDVSKKFPLICSNYVINSPLVSVINLTEQNGSNSDYLKKLSESLYVTNLRPSNLNYLVDFETFVKSFKSKK